MATGGYGGAIAPPLLPKDGPRDSSKIDEKMAGYRLGKIFFGELVGGDYVIELCNGNL